MSAVCPWKPALESVEFSAANASRIVVERWETAELEYQHVAGVVERHFEGMSLDAVIHHAVTFHALQTDPEAVEVEFWEAEEASSWPCHGSVVPVAPQIFAPGYPRMHQCSLCASSVPMTSEYYCQLPYMYFS